MCDWKPHVSQRPRSHSSRTAKKKQKRDSESVCVSELDYSKSSKKTHEKGLITKADPAYFLTLPFTAQQLFFFVKGVCWISMAKQKKGSRRL